MVERRAIRNGFLDGLPGWAKDLSEKYYSRSFSMFVLHGNVRDLVPLVSEGTAEFVPLEQFSLRPFSVSGTWCCITTAAV